MGKTFLSIGLLLAAILASGRGLADEQCRAVAYADYQAALDACGDGGGIGGPQQCAQGTRCDSRYQNGSCRDWADYEVCGRMCKTGRSCDNKYNDGSCRDWQVDAVCGTTCGSSEVCQSRYSNGSCREWKVVVTCTP